MRAKWSAPIRKYWKISEQICSFILTVYQCKQLYIVHGADHTENYRKDPGGYEKIVTKFIEERLRQKKCQTPGTKP